MSDNRVVEKAPRCYCTAALPGQAFQDIYTCRKCFHDGSALNCLCRACAETCHASCRMPNNDNDDDDDDDDEEEAVEYIGMGPANCDCHAQSAASTMERTAAAAPCQLYNASVEKAQALLRGNEWDASCTLPRQKQQGDQQQTTTDPIQVYDIPVLQATQQAAKIISQAVELIRHSKETFWINTDNSASTTTELCLLEHLAGDILQYHSQMDRVPYRGAEWWVQVKPSSTTSNDDDDDNNNAAAAAASSIDMHYDKDEVLAEAFGLGAFPTGSTVTYLTTGAATTTAAPTLIFPRTYHHADNETMSHVYLSRPRTGKHVKFDGSLLHGAIPLLVSAAAAEATASYNDTPPQDASSSSSASSPLRVTFLVNLWKDHQPLGIQSLPNDIRQALLQKTNEDDDSAVLLPPIVLQARKAIIPNVEAASSLDWTSLPFVQDGMVVKTVNLANVMMNAEQTLDVLCVQYQAGREAYLDYPDDDDDASEEEDDQEDGG